MVFIYCIYMKVFALIVTSSVCWTQAHKTIMAAQNSLLIKNLIKMKKASCLHISHIISSKYFLAIWGQLDNWFHNKSPLSLMDIYHGKMWQAVNRLRINESLQCYYHFLQSKNSVVSLFCSLPKQGGSLSISCCWSWFH